MRIAFEDLAVTVGNGVRALDGVSGAVEEGTVTAVVGPSGAGKSTLLQVLAGLVRPDAGSVQIHGEDVTRQSPQRRRLGVVFQDLRLFPFLSGRENVAFGPRVAGLSRVEQARRTDEAIELVRAARFADRSVRVLSGGERQRIAIARALALAPRGLLLDEPLSALDAELRRGLRDELREVIARLRLTTLFVTHDRDDAFALASHLLVLRDGRVEQAGEVAHCYQRPASSYVATLLGEASLVAVSQRSDGTALVGDARLEVHGSGARAVLRPERFRCALDGETPHFRGALVDARFAGGSWRVVVKTESAGALVALLPRAPDGPEVALRHDDAAATVD